MNVLHPEKSHTRFGVLLCVVLFAVFAGVADARPVSDPLSPPEFSHQAGFYEQPFQLSLTHADPDVRIYYTLDGSIPDPHNLNGTTWHYKNEYAQPPNPPSGELLHAEYQTYVYSDAIPIRDRRAEPDRLAHISTTLDAIPDYFPQPVVDAYSLNFVIQQTNRGIRKFNALANRAERDVRQAVVDKEYQHTDREYLPRIPYRAPYDHLYKGSVVRAVAVDADGRPSAVRTETYFIGDVGDFTLPIVSLVVPENGLFGYDDGILVAGRDYDDALRSGGATQRVSNQRPANWQRRGSDVPAHLSIFDQSGGRVASTNVDIRVQGGASRSYSVKSFRIYPRARYDADGLVYDLFNDGRPLGLDRLVLRNGGQEYRRSFLKDAAIHQIVAGLGFGTQRYAPVVLFVNGEYYGIRNARDRLDQRYLASRFDLPGTKVDILEKHTDVKRGSAEAWERVLQYVAEQPKNDAGFLAGLDALIDIDSFVDYYSANIFIGNTDWPANNLARWRYAGDAESHGDGKGFADGRWRWLMFDTDSAFNLKRSKSVKHNTLAYATGADDDGSKKLDWSTFMLRTLLENEPFRDRFVTRFSDLLNSTFVTSRMVDIIRQTQAGIEPEMPRHIHRWNSPPSMGRWHREVDGLVKFAKQRPAIQRQHLQEFFDLGPLYTVSVDVSERTAGRVQLNTLTLGQPLSASRVLRDGYPDIGHQGDRNQGLGYQDALALPWSGHYYQGLPLRVEALPAKGYRFSHWEGDGLTEAQAQERVLVLQPTADVTIRAVMMQDDS